MPNYSQVQRKIHSHLLLDIQPPMGLRKFLELTFLTLTLYHTIPTFNDLDKEAF